MPRMSSLATGSSRANGSDSGRISPTAPARPVLSIRASRVRSGVPGRPRGLEGPVAELGRQLVGPAEGVRDRRLGDAERGREIAQRQACRGGIGSSMAVLAGAAVGPLGLGGGS